MKTELKTIYQLFQYSDIFEMPSFQRPYVWGKIHLERLLDSIKDIMEEIEEDKSRFLGTIVLQPQQTTNPHHIVIDGQQRITTISLILKVLSDMILEASKNDKQFENFLIGIKEEKLFSKQGVDGKQIYKLKPLEFQCSNWEILISQGVENLDLCKYKENYEILRDELETILEFLEYKDIEKIRIFYNTLLHKIQCVVITLDKIDDPFEIFETLNSLGEPLSTRDLIKNALLQKESPEHDTLYIHRWKPIFERDENTTDFWESKGPEERSSEKHQDFFFRCYLQIQLDEELELKKGQKLYAKYRDYLTLKNKEDELSNIQKYAETYRRIFSDTQVNFPQDINILIRLLKNLGRSIYYPFILFYLTKFKEEGSKISQLLSSYIITRILAKDKVTDKGTNKTLFHLLNKAKIEGVEGIYNFFITRNKRDQSSIDIFPTYKQVQDGIEKSAFSEKTSKAILIYLEESYNNKLKESKEMSIAKNIELEHIIPKKWEQYWGSILSHKKPEMIKKEIKKLGNLTLVTGEFNKKLRNYIFEQKKGEYKNSNLYLNKNLIEYFSIFEFESVKARAIILSNLLEEIIVYP